MKFFLETMEKAFFTVLVGLLSSTFILSITLFALSTETSNNFWTCRFPLAAVSIMLPFAISQAVEELSRLNRKKS